MRELSKATVAMISDFRLDALHFLGNALLLGAAMLWLLIPEAHVWQLILAALSAVLLVFAFAWLHCGTLAHGVTASRDAFGADFLRVLRRVPAFVVLSLLMIVLMSWAAELSDRSWQISGYLFTKLPHWLATRIGEYRLNQWVELKVVALAWIAIPAIFLPWLAALAANGIVKQAVRAALRTYLRWKYWLGIVVVGVIGVFVPRMLMGWTPGHGLRNEMISMVLRLTAAYVLAVLAWLAAVAIVGKTLRDSLSAGHTSGEPVA